MKVFIRTLQNNKYELEVSPEESILSVKEKVQSTHGLAAPELQKLIFNGKVLKDDQTLQQAKVKEGGFIVLMVSKKQTPKPLPEPQIPAATPSSEPQIPASTPPSSEPQIASAAPSSAPQVLQSAASDLARGPAYEQIVSQLMDLGFPRDQVVRCLAAGFNNPERAVEYLLGGIPAHLMSENPAQNAAAQPAADQIPADLADDGSVGDEIDEAQMAQELAALQQALQQNPQMLQQMIAVLAQQYPELVPYLGNREIVMKLLQDPAILAGLMGALGAAGAQSPGGTEGGLPSNVIRVTEEEKAALERLESMGFPRRKVLEAYLACDKNEELAANYLFEHAYDDEDEEMDAQSPPPSGPPQ